MRMVDFYLYLFMHCSQLHHPQPFSAGGSHSGRFQGKEKTY